MNRQEKEQVVQDLNNHFRKNDAAFLVNYQGLTVAHVQRLRSQLRKQSCQMCVAKARLMRIAIEDVPTMSGLKPFFKDQIAVVFAKDSPAAAKVLFDFSKDYSLKLVAGVLGAHFLDARSIESMAKLPPREQLLAQLAGVLKAPIVRLAQGMQQLLVRPVVAIKQLKDQRRGE